MRGRYCCGYRTQGRAGSRASRRWTVPVIKAERPRASICLLSGTSETDPPMQEGVDAFVRKPFDIEHLNETVRQLSMLALER